MYTAKDHMAVHCVGNISEYTSLLKSCSGNTSLQTIKYLYYGEQLSLSHAFGRSVLLLNTSISNVSFCIINNIEHLLFFHNGSVISEADTELLNRLEQEYLKNKSYLLLKQLNIIKLAFDIRRKSVVLSSLPIHIQMEHTTFCNARCIMCDHYIAHNRGSKHLKLSTVKSLESLFPYASMIIMHGNGEPLINPDILPIFELYKKYQIKTSLNTNLSYLTEDILTSIRDNCESIHVSCDGSNEKQYESIRLGLSYSEFIKNVKRLSSVCNKTEKVLEVVLMRQNIKDAKKFVQFAYDHGFAKVIFNALGCNKWIGNEKDGLNNYHSSAIHYCSLAKDEGNRLGISVITPFEYFSENKTADACTVIEEDYPDPVNAQILHDKYPWYTNTIATEQLDRQSISECDTSYDIRGVCEYPFAKTYIDLCGNVSFCCPASRKIVDRISDDHKFEDIWNGWEYQRIRETFYGKGMPLLCKNCFFIKNKALNFLSLN